MANGGLRNDEGGRSTPDPFELAAKLSGAEFAEQVLDFHPDPKQRIVLSSRIKRGLLNCIRQWGKSTTTSIKALHHVMQAGNRLAIVVSPSARQSAEFLRKVEGWMRWMNLKVRGDGDNSISVLLENKSRLVGLPGSEGRIRGFSAVSMLLIDEASRVSDQMYRAVRPMLATTQGELWLMSTPFGRRGFFWEEWSNGGAGWTRISVPATECPRITTEFLEEEKAHLAEWFQQEYMCEFTSTDDQLFSNELLDTVFTREVRPL